MKANESMYGFIGNVKSLVAKKVPRYPYSLVRFIFQFFHPRREFTIPLPSGRKWVLFEILYKEKFYIPHPTNVQSQKKYKENRFKSHNYPNFVQVEPGDVVLDIGAFVGGFSIPSSELAKEVFAIEPGPIASECLQLNTKNIDNIQSFQYGVLDENGKLEFTLAKDPTDNSFLSPEKPAGTVVVQTLTIDQLLSKLDIEQIDFMKIAAEGGQLRILEGMSDSRPLKIVTSELSGNTNEVEGFLQRIGYKTKKRDNLIFAFYQDN